MSDQSYSIQSIVVTGALGNLGTKLLAHLHKHESNLQLIGLDTRPALESSSAIVPGVEYIQCDLTSWHDRDWGVAIDQADAVVHFAARNAAPDASWEEAAASLDMTLHVANAALDNPRTKRVVFATSNHVMGRYKDEPLASQIGTGQLATALPPAVGTIWYTGSKWIDSTGYATSKAMGERVCKASAARSKGKTTFAAIRIGWCQPAENHPSTLSAVGAPGEVYDPTSSEVDAESVERTAHWFKTMWLSNRDFLQVFSKAIFHSGANWPDGYILVNGMSNNHTMKWSLAEGRQWLGYEPVDDVFSAARSV